MKNIKKIKKEKSWTALDTISTPDTKNLESTLKEKVSPLLEETMEKHWGISIPKVESDITDQLKKPQLDLYLASRLPFFKAKKQFQAEFIKRELRLHRGNISQLAKTLRIDRRSVHRAIKDLEINVEKARGEAQERENYRQNIIGHAIRSTLENYKEIIQPQKLESVYQDLPSISRNIAKVLPHQDLTWKEAEQEFEKQFLLQALEENNWNITQMAEKIKMRAETVHRKIKRLQLKRLRS